MSDLLRAAALAGLLALLGACAAPTGQNESLAQLFWTSPSHLEASTRLPEGLGTAGPVRLIMVLKETGGTAARQQSFTLAPVSGRDGTHRLERKDHRRFTQFQNRVVASIGAQAQVNVELLVPYCRKPGESPGQGAPVVVLSDVSDGSVLMSSPAPVSARQMYSKLPDCG